MPTGYQRQSVASIVTGNVINASDSNNEYNAILAAFDKTTGHIHDGTTVGGGAAILAVNGVAFPGGPSTNTVPVVTASNTITYEVVPNAALANSSLTLGTTSVALGSTTTVLDGLTFTGSNGSFANATITSSGTFTGAAISGGTYTSATLTNPTINSFTGTGTLTLTGSTIAGGTYTSSSLTSPTLTGIPVAPTASTSTNTTQVATCAYVQSNLANYLPLTGGSLAGSIDVVGSIGLPSASHGKYGGDSTYGAIIAGSGSTYDTSIFNKNGAQVSGVITGTTIMAYVSSPQSPTPSASDSSNKLATTAYVQEQFVTGRVLANPANFVTGSSGEITKTGTTTGSGGGGGGTSGADIVSFATPFPNACISVQLTQRRTGQVAVVFLEGVPTTSSFSWRAVAISNGLDTTSVVEWTAKGY